MSARHKLNVAAGNGILLIAGVSALLCQSWTVFWLLSGVLLLGAIASGSIRSGKRGGRRR
jgi:hypothetical protein